MTIRAERANPLLVGQVWVVDRGQPSGIPVLEYPMQLQSGDIDPARDDQSSIAEVNEADLTAILNPPAVTKIGRQAGLAPMGDLGVRDCCHGCIVTCRWLQGTVVSASDCRGRANSRLVPEQGLGSDHR